MRLFLIKNVSRDPQYAYRRRANPLYVTKIPTINGHRLFPRTSFQVSEEDLSQSEIQSIENLIKAGVVTVSILGGELHIQTLADSVDSPEEVLEVPEPLISEDEDTLSVEEPVEDSVEEPVEEPAEEEVSVETEAIPEEPSPVEIAEIVEENEEDSSNYTESDLVKMKNSELRELLSIIDPDFASAGVKKSILVERILEKQ